MCWCVVPPRAPLSTLSCVASGAIRSPPPPPHTHTRCFHRGGGGLASGISTNRMFAIPYAPHAPLERAPPSSPRYRACAGQSPADESGSERQPADHPACLPAAACARGVHTSSGQQPHHGRGRGLRERSVPPPAPTPQHTHAHAHTHSHRPPPQHIRVHVRAAQGSSPSRLTAPPLLLSALAQPWWGCCTCPCPATPLRRTASRPCVSCPP
jgi:hypothetical protein